MIVERPAYASRAADVAPAEDDGTLHLLADVAREFATPDPARVRDLRDAGGRLDRDMWQRFAEVGWLGIMVPEKAGGAGLGLEAAAIVARRLGYAGFPEPFVSAGVLAPQLLAVSSAPSATRLLADVIAGGTVVDVAWQGNAGGLDLTAVEVALSAVGETARLSGASRFVTVADADVFLVAARGTDGVSVHQVPADAAGLTVIEERRADGTSSARLSLQEVAVSAEARVLEPAVGTELVLAAVDVARVAICAELVGVIDRVIEMTTEYLGQRKQFGRPIGSMQALQHRVADAWIQGELSSAALEAAVRIHADPASSAIDRATAASSVKARVSLATPHICNEALQLHGAIGFTDEYDLGLYLNRALSLAPWLGTAAEHRRRYAALEDITRKRTPTGVPRTSAPERAADWSALADEDFRAIVREEVEANYPSELRFPSRRLFRSEQGEWVSHLAEKGWIAPGWPQEFGGMGLSSIKQVIFAQELERFGVARYQDHGVTQVGPVIMRFGSEEQRERWLPPILRAEHIWAQGYSEPEAGSDLASLRTRALRDGDEYLIDGQKIWTTFAHDATHIYVLVRTDSEVKPQAGISFLLADLATPGITVRPIRDIAGHCELCEVFFDQVRVPVENRIGEENHGWTIAKSLLGHERINVGSPKQAGYALEMVVAVARARGLLEDPVFRDRLAVLQLDVAHLGDAYARYTAMLARGEEIGQDVSMLKVRATQTVAAIADLIIEAGGDAGGLAGDVPLGDSEIDVLGAFYRARPAMIYAGSNEIQKNIIATTVLGMPRA